MRQTLAVLALLLPLAACSDTGAGDQAAPTRNAATGQERVTVVVGDAAPVQAEVADTPEERAVGLMRRTEVPPGTGMVFRYDAPSTGKYYMYDVPVPLTAVFALAGRVVFVVDMPPCPLTVPQDCPVYGPDGSYDTVLETAPETLRGKVEVGDPLRVEA